MSDPLVMAAFLAIVAVGLLLLVLQSRGRRRKGYRWQPDLSYRVDVQSTIEENNSALYLTEKSAEERHEERKDYLKERAEK